MSKEVFVFVLDTNYFSHEFLLVLVLDIVSK